jgi:hypothetical protein
MQFFNLLEKKCHRYRAAATTIFPKPTATAPPWTSLFSFFVNKPSAE